MIFPTQELWNDFHDDACEATERLMTEALCIQSCLNHSCRPSVAALKPQGEDLGGIEEQGDVRGQVKGWAEGGSTGEATLVALRKILPGEEVTVSYIEEEELPTVVARRKALQDYGFW